MINNKKKLIPLEFIHEYGHRAGDEFIKSENLRLGVKLCARCKGYGNEFYSMYRACSQCDGTGIAPDKYIITDGCCPVCDGTLVETSTKEFVECDFCQWSNKPL